MSKEIFKVIPAYPNYEVSTSGRVRRRAKGHFLKWVDNGKGYKVVKLYNQQRPQGRLCLVHRLVLSTFSPIHVDKDVNHIDGDKSNNHISNLEWVSKSENTRHAHLTGLFGNRNKLSIEQVREIKSRIQTQQFQTYTQMGDEYGVKPSIISKIANGGLYDYV